MAEVEDVYCTLVLNDDYLPGAIVLAHSLIDCGTTHKLACLVTVDTLSAESIDTLRSIYNYVIAVPRIANPSPSNLHLMGRPDLLFAFTKIHVWRQTQFRKIIYLDADVVALRAPEELFDIADNFAAAPDVGWPDAFNTGVMVVTPDQGEYRALQNMAAAGDSFDGADQGLLNQYFEHKPWKRLSFTYNCTPSASYQYEPAYRYHKSGISLVHFIGRQKPWLQHPSNASSIGVYQELLSRWWAVHDRHSAHGQYSDSHVTAPRSVGSEKESLASAGYPPDQEIVSAETILQAEAPQSGDNTEHSRRAFEAPRAEWDGTRAAPPVESKPEAVDFPSTVYHFNASPTLFRPPTQYPDPPKNMWFEVPAKPDKPDKAAKLPAIFPWEERQLPTPSRRFEEDEDQTAESDTLLDTGEFSVEAEENSSPATPTITVTDANTWDAFGPSNRNAWDEVSGIDNYVRALTSRQKTRGQVQVLQHDSSDPAVDPSPDADLGSLVDVVRERRESLILTDFPSAIERPSLPVTPAPRRRTTFWGDERDDQGNLPSAEGVPDQADWNPTEQLEQLRRSSLIGPEQLKLHALKHIPDRASISSAVAIPDPVPGQAIVVASDSQTIH